MAKPFGFDDPFLKKTEKLPDQLAPLGGAPQPSAAPPPMPGQMPPSTEQQMMSAAGGAVANTAIDGAIKGAKDAQDAAAAVTPEMIEAGTAGVEGAAMEAAALGGGVPYGQMALGALKGIQSGEYGNALKDTLASAAGTYFGGPLGGMIAGKLAKSINLGFEAGTNRVTIQNNVDANSGPNPNIQRYNDAVAGGSTPGANGAIEQGRSVINGIYYQGYMRPDGEVYTQRMNEDWTPYVETRPQYTQMEMDSGIRIGPDNRTNQQIIDQGGTTPGGVVAPPPVGVGGAGSAAGGVDSGAGAGMVGAPISSSTLSGSIQQGSGGGYAGSSNVANALNTPGMQTQNAASANPLMNDSLNTNSPIIDGRQTSRVANDYWFAGYEGGTPGVGGKGAAQAGQPQGQVGGPQTKYPQIQGYDPAAVGYAKVAPTKAVNNPYTMNNMSNGVGGKGVGAPNAQAPASKPGMQQPAPMPDPTQPIPFTGDMSYEQWQQHEIARRLRNNPFGGRW
jgi:hypothetical protein